MPYCIYNYVWYHVSLECSAVVWIASMGTRAIFGRNHSLTCSTQLWGTGCNIDGYVIYREDQPKSTKSTVGFRPLKLSDAGYYLCTVTVNGHNVTSHPTFNPVYAESKYNWPLSIIYAEYIQEFIHIHAVPSSEVIASSSLENPIPLRSQPTLTCTIILDPSIDNDVKITISWSGPVFGFGKFIVTEPVLNSSAEVPTYMSSASLSAQETFYDSGLYRCSAMVSPVHHQDYIRNSSTSSQGISGKIIECLHLQ